MQCYQRSVAAILHGSLDNFLRLERPRRLDLRMTSQFTAWPSTQRLLRPSNDREAEMPLALADLQSQNTRSAMAARRGGDGGRQPQAKRQRQQSPCAGPGSAGAERRQGWRRHWWSRALASPGNSFACSRQSRHTCATHRKARRQGVGLLARGEGADGRRVRGRADKEATSRGMVAAELASRVRARMQAPLRGRAKVAQYGRAPCTPRPRQCARSSPR